MTHMALQDTYDLESIRNQTASLVHERWKACFPGAARDLCRCSTCVLDLVAFTLNRVTPRYATSVLGDLHPDPVSDKRIRVQIDLALEAGIKRLRIHPHHG